MTKPRKKRKKETRPRKPPKVPWPRDPETGKYMSRKKYKEKLMKEATQMPTTEEQAIQEQEQAALESAVIESQFIQDPSIQEMENQTELHTMESPAEEPSSPTPTDQEKEESPQPPVVFPRKLTGTEIKEMYEEPPTPKSDPDTSKPTNPRPQETSSSSQESPDPRLQIPDEPEYARLVDYMKVNLNEAFVMAQMAAILGNPQVLPHVSYWTTPADVNVPLLICEIIKQPQYISAVFPVLQVVMGRSLSNIQWAASVLITLAFFDLLKLLPHAQHLGVSK